MEPGLLSLNVRVKACKCQKSMLIATSNLYRKEKNIINKNMAQDDTTIKLILSV